MVVPEPFPVRLRFAIETKLGTVGLGRVETVFLGSLVRCYGKFMISSCQMKCRRRFSWLRYRKPGVRRFKVFMLCHAARNDRIGCNMHFTKFILIEGWGMW